MKKNLFLLLACVLTFSVATAQEKERHFEVSVSSGLTTFVNYPGLSLLEDNTERYSKVGAGLTFIYRLDDITLGVQVQSINNLTTSQLQHHETLQYGTVSLLTRHYGRLGDKLEPFYGLKIGMAMMRNSLRHLETTVDETRPGWFSELEMGLNYKFSERSFMGVSVGTSIVASRFDNNYEVPATLNKNLNTDFLNYSVMLSYGIRF